MFFKGRSPTTKMFKLISKMFQMLIGVFERLISQLQSCLKLISVKCSRCLRLQDSRGSSSWETDYLPRRGPRRAAATRAPAPPTWGRRPWSTPSMLQRTKNMIITRFGQRTWSTHILSIANYIWPVRTLDLTFMDTMAARQGGWSGYKWTLLTVW